MLVEIQRCARVTGAFDVAVAAADVAAQVDDVETELL